MKNIAKLTIGALSLAAAALVTAPADARVFVGFGIGPGYYGPPPPAPYAYCGPYGRWYGPYDCDDYYSYPYPYYGYYGYGGPVFYGEFGGGFHHRHFDRWGHGGWGGRWHR